MRHILAVIAVFFSWAALAQSEDPLSKLQWVSRPLIVFADTAKDPRYIRQMELLSVTPDELAKRDVVILTDTDPGDDSVLRQSLHPRDFMLVLIGKDGRVAFRKPTPWSVREISRAIDKMPLRQDEILEELGK